MCCRGTEGQIADIMCRGSTDGGMSPSRSSQDAAEVHTVLLDRVLLVVCVFFMTG